MCVDNIAESGSHAAYTPARVSAAAQSAHQHTSQHIHTRIRPQRIAIGFEWLDVCSLVRNDGKYHAGNLDPQQKCSFKIDRWEATTDLAHNKRGALQLIDHRYGYIGFNRISWVSETHTHTCSAPHLMAVNYIDVARIHNRNGSDTSIRLYDR